jgi:transcriptional regulator with XRE-family HTH domain
LPFCHVRLSARKPVPKGYPSELRTVGDHLRKRRLDLGLRQKDVARRLGANVNTVTNWEVGRTAPAARYAKGIVRLLGYAPFGTDGAFQSGSGVPVADDGQPRRGSRPLRTSTPPV